MDLQLKNKVVLVTGGAKGIGASIVLAACCEYYYCDATSLGFIPPEGVKCISKEYFGR